MVNEWFRSYKVLRIQKEALKTKISLVTPQTQAMFFFVRQDQLYKTLDWDDAV